MIKKINTLIFILVAFICNLNAYAQKTVIGSKDMPLELNLLLESYQAQSPDNFVKVLPVILNIDLYARALSKEDIFLIGKIEIYKTLLKNYDTPIKQPIDGATVELLRSSLSKASDNFTKWFIQALLKDSKDLINSPTYKEFLLQKNSNIKIEKIEYRKLEKKGELLQYWISKINPEALDFPETLKAELAPKLLEALKNIQSSFYLMAKESSLIPLEATLKNESELKFFTIKDVIPMAAPAKDKLKSVEDILAPIIDKDPLPLPAPSQENWLDDENAPPSLQNLPKPSNDADWLQDF